ncbi:MAG: adenylate/guanylate cyclase domain-containing protein [Acidimicrobiia bacterium]
MARLSASDRARLPDSAFAYVDSQGRRRLPINDSSHVRNALARFDQVEFESEAGRRKARERLLNAARKHGIVPVGFITGQLRADQRHAAAGRFVIELARVGTSDELEHQLREALSDPTLTVLVWSEQAGSYVDVGGRPFPLPTATRRRQVALLEARGRPAAALVHDHRALADPDIAEAVLAAVRFVVERERLDTELASRPVATAGLPTGFVTHLLTDIEGSTPLLAQLGDRYADLLAGMRRIIRREVVRAGGREVEARADEYVAVFEEAIGAVKAAIAFQRVIASRKWPGGVEVRVRVGIHSGEITLTESGYVGLSVHAAARVMTVADGGQILTTRATLDAIGPSTIEGVEFRSLGSRRLAGLPQPEELLVVEADRLVGS